MGDLLCAIDQGTTGTRCLLVDASGRPVAERYATHRQHHPAPGLVEHDAEEIWTRTCQVVAAAVAEAGGAARVVAVGIANQRETVVLWERATGRPLAPAVVWQDLRTEDVCAALAGTPEAEEIRERTGLVVAPYFSATKLARLLDTVPGARRRAEAGELAAGTIDAWLLSRLTGVHATDATNASRTLLASLDDLAWDERLCELLRVPPALLPTIAPTWSSDAYGRTLAGGPLPAGVPVTGVIGDQQSALLGQACVAAGEAKCTYGTGSFLLGCTGERPRRSTHGLLASPALAPPAGPASYCLEGSIAVTGRAIGWLADELGILDSPAESAAVAASVPDAGGVRVVPAFQGLFAPWWDGSARGAVLGLSLHSTRAHVVRATLESIAFLTRAVVEALEADAGVRLPALRVDGGATANDVLMQLQADVLGRPVVRPRVRETTALGAAFAAGLGAGVWDAPSALRGLVAEDRVFEPSWPDDRREAEWADWLRAVERARGWVEG